MNQIYKIGNLICELRENKNLSQSELGKLVGVTNKAVSRWENGRGYPDTSILLKLAEVLEITVDELLRGELSISVKEDNKNINYIVSKNAESQLFKRFLLTLIPQFIYWLLLIINIKTSHLWNLDYRTTALIAIICPSVISLILQILFGVLFTLKWHLYKNIKLINKILLSIVTVFGLGICYIPCFIYMVIRLIKSKKANILN